MDNPTSRHLIDLIKQKAIKKWGEDYWFSELVRAYCKYETAATGKPLKPVQRRSQLDRMFREDSTKITLETAALLLKSVGGDINIVFTNPEVVKL